MVLSIRPFTLDRSAAHLCVDMQRLFAEETPWHVPLLSRILPCVAEIARHHAARTVFTRFVPPGEPAEAQGAWLDYYGQWRNVTCDHLDPRLLDLVEPLADLAPPALVVDKQVSSVFSRPGLARALGQRGITTLVITGGETDVCVLATVMAAVDLGFRVVLPTDALCTTNGGTHDTLRTLYRERFASQIETTTTEDILRRWS